MINYSPLPDRAVLAVTGPDARDFLQGLISNDIRKATSQSAIFAALLSPQGKFLFDFFIVEHEGRLLLETEKTRLPDLIKRLGLYRLRSKVTFEPLDLSVAATWEIADPAKDEPVTSTANCLISYHDPRLPPLGWRMLFNDLPAFPEKALASYDAYRIALGVPDGAQDLIPDRSILLEYGYDELGGVDFAKGCYVGQEVTARSKHRAQLRKFIHTVKARFSLPEKGTPVLLEGREIGIMASSVGTTGLAHLRAEDVANAAREGKTLTAGNAPLSAQLPEWCRTAFTQGG